MTRSCFRESTVIQCDVVNTLNNDKRKNIKTMTLLKVIMIFLFELREK